MKYRLLGKSGLRVSSLSMGVAAFGSRWGPHWTMSTRDADALIGAALDHGINYFDTANVYNQGESESWLGGALRSHSARQSVLVSSKFGYRTNPKDCNSGGSSRRCMFSSVERSLSRLGTECIDILYMHLWDAITPMEETLSAASDLVTAGKIRYLCLSNVPSWYLGRASALCEWRGWTQPAAVQLNYNLLTRGLEPEFFSYMSASGLGLVAWGPLANGLLSGRYHVDGDARQITGSGRVTEAFSTGHIDPFGGAASRVLPVLTRLAAKTELSASVLSLAWLLRRPHVSTVLMGVSSLEQLRENLRACEVVASSEVWSELDAASAPALTVPYEFLQPALLRELVYGAEEQEQVGATSGPQGGASRGTTG